MTDTKAPILFKCPTCPASVPQSELLRHIATCDTTPSVTHTEPTLGGMWGATFGHTFRAVRSRMITRKFRWVSRLIMFPLVFITLPVPAVGCALLSFVAWRMVRTAQVLGRRMETARSQKASQPQKTRNVRRIRFEIKIG